jgi:antitoxin ParD1/3/4
VIRGGLLVLIARNRAVQAWLHKEVAAAYDGLKASPSRAVRASGFRERLAQVHRKAADKA